MTAGVQKKDLSRRDFLKFGGAASFGMALSVLDPAPQAAENRLLSGFPGQHALQNSPSSRFQLGRGTVRQVAWSPDGQTIWIAGSCGVYAFAAGTLQEQPGFDPGFSVDSIAVGPDGRLAAVRSKNGVIQLLDVQTLDLAHTLPGTPGKYRCLEFSRDGRFLAAGGQSLQLWDVPSGQLLWEIWGPEESSRPDDIKSVVFNHSGEIEIVTNGAGKSDAVQKLELGTGACLRTIEISLGQDNPVVRFSPDGRRFALSGQSGIRVQDVPSGRVLTAIGDLPEVKDLAFSPDGLILAVLGDILTLWQVKTGQFLGAIEGFTAPVLDLALHPNGVTLAALGTDALRFWDTNTGLLLRTFDDQLVQALAFHPDGRTLALSARNHPYAEERVWIKDLLANQSGLPWLAKWADHLDFSRDGQLLLTSSSSATVQIWDMETGSLQDELPGFAGSIQAIALSPDGAYVAAADDTGAYLIWEIANRRQKASGIVPGSVYCLAFSPDCSTLLAGTASGEFFFLSIGREEQTGPMRGHTGPVYSIAFGPGGQLFASGGEDGLVRVWEASTGQLRLTFEGHREPVTSVKFRADGKALLSGGYDGTVRLWEIDN